MIDEPGDVAPDSRVAAPDPVHTKAPDAALFEVPFLARLAFIAVPEQLAGALNTARVLRNRLRGENAEAVDGGFASNDFREPRPPLHGRHRSSLYNVCRYVT